MLRRCPLTKNFANDLPPAQPTAGVATTPEIQGKDRTTRLLPGGGSGPLTAETRVWWTRHTFACTLPDPVHATRRKRDKDVLLGR